MKLLQISTLQKFKELQYISQKHKLLVPPHFFDTKSSKHSLQEIHDMWNVLEIATIQPKHNSLYIHIPYCMKRCSFCMYDSKIRRNDNITPYIDRIIKEFNFWSDNINTPIDSFYIGGGTPSIMSVLNVKQLFNSLSEKLSFCNNSSRTFELSPDTINMEKLYELGETFINRISLGIQSMDENVLRNANRPITSPQKIRQIINIAKEISFDDINIDLMVGLNGQTTTNVESSVKQIIELAPLSVTIYSYRDVHNISEWKHENRILEINKQLLSAYDIFKKYGWEHASGNLDTEYNIFYSPEKRKKLIRHKTSIDTLSNLNLFGLGNHAIGFNPSLAYKCDSFSDDFDKDEKRYIVYKHTPIQQMELAICNMLYCNNMQIDRNLFYDSFGCNFEDVFEKELEELQSINRIIETPYGYKFINNSKYEAAAIQMFFWDKKFLQQYK